MAFMNFEQSAQLMGAISEQASGQAGASVPAPSSEAEFVSVAKSTLSGGYDAVIGAISNVLSRTIFSIRPYYRKFAGINTNAIRYGSHVRKLTIVDAPVETDQRFEDGADMFAVNKPVVVQVNFHGALTYQRHITIYKDQLDTAFSSSEEFGAFIAMIVQNTSDLIEKDHENCARMTIANFIGGKIAGEADSVVHLVSEFNAKTGLQLTAQTVRKPENFSTFMKFVMARIRTISELMTERSTLFHTNPGGNNISRHTPLEKQKVYLYAPDIHDMETNVLSSVYHDEYLKKVDFETVNYWQSISDPMRIEVNATYMDTASGDLGRLEVSQNNVFGVIFDEEALGYTVVNAWSASSPFNAAGGYTNIYHHFTDRYWNDFTENGVVLLLD